MDFTYDFTPNKTPKFICTNCDFKCYKNSDYERHIHTAKHISRTKLNVFTPKNATHLFCCKYCKKEYNARNSLWYHEKKCKVNEESKQITEETPKSSEENITIEISEKKPENPQQMNENFIIEFLKQNQEFQKQFLEAIKNNIGTHTTHTNSHNKFNLNVFLNETCKDACNITDFVSGIKLGFKDFESFGSGGYVNSISNIFIRELQDLDVTKRPIHCSDLKREVIHVKDNDAWVKDEEKKHMKRAIKLIEHKNIKMVPDWLKANPKADDITTKKHEEYMKILDNSMGEMKDEDNERNYEKIIKNVSKKILIEKDP